MQALRTYMENSAKYRDIAQAFYDEAIRLLEKIVDSDFKDYYLSQET